MISFVRKFIIPIHRWVALSVGLVVILTAITGALIVFRPQLEPILYRDLITAERCAEIAPLDNFIAKAKLARPEATVDYIRIVKGDDSSSRMPAMTIRYTDQSFIYLNPCTTEVLGFRHRYGGILGTIEQIHRWRYISGEGEYISWGPIVTGGSAIIFAIVLLIGGVVILFATLPKNKSAFTLKNGLTGIPRNLDLHKTLGLYAAPILLISVLTGLPQAYDWYRNGIYEITGSKPVKAPKIVEPSPPEPRVSMESIWKKIQELEPNPKETLIHYEVKEGNALDSYIVGANAAHANARSMLYVNQYSGEVVKYIPYEKSSTGFKLYFWTLTWHSGKAGLVAQLIILFGALAVPVLAYFGISAYLKRSRRSKA